MTRLLILLCLIAVAKPAAAQGILNRCDVMDDDEDRYWCYMDMAKEEKSLKPCASQNWMWADISHCIEFVQKERPLKEEDCADIPKYESTCLDKLGFKVEDVRITINEVLMDLKMDRMRPNAPYLAAGTKPVELLTFKKSLLGGQPLETWTITKVATDATGDGGTKVFVDLNLAGQIAPKVMIFRRMNGKWALSL